MTSFCHSLQEAPSSIIQTMTDEFEAVLMELRSYSLDTLERKCEKRSNTFATVRGEAKKTFCRLQDMPKKYEVPISKIQRSIDELKNRNKAEDEVENLSRNSVKILFVIVEKDALVRRLSEFDEVERKRKAEVEKLREKDELMEAVIELNNENIDLINSDLFFKLQTQTTQHKEQEVSPLLSNGEVLDCYIVSCLISIGGFGQIPLLKGEATCLHSLNCHHNPYGDEPREPILRYLTYGSTERLRYLVMDHCGANLRELKRASPNSKFRYFMNIDGSCKKRKASSPFHGTLRYASINTHNRQDLCRWDDLWSVYYIAIENMAGALPWRFISDRKKVAEMKINCEYNTLQYGEESSMPQPLRMLAYHLFQSYRDRDSSFYTAPPYGRIIREVEYDLDLRHFYKSSPLDWETEQQSTCPVRDLLFSSSL
ncbi:hypothetical protein NECAME_13524 [Necator americanus]|uniref:Protein kinase domain-containing protein n=1 Tax=Necator americanus TaxID=51031 RepID=W2SUY0_NECAM|nr:hypothetical protein NECAME_13524 [Necator americanus]ETN73435.1 hypothetical protein NECAME_13524 [Necator americanus]